LLMAIQPRLGHSLAKLVVHPVATGRTGVSTIRQLAAHKQS